MSDRPAREDGTPADGGITVTSSFVRHRNVLITRARLTDLYLDYYLHLADQGRQVAPEADRLFKEMLAAFVLHVASRPLNEMVAWTVNLQQPLLNFFATADNETGAVVGRVFTENVKQGPANLFYVETVRGRDPTRRSVIDFEGAGLFAAAERFYQKSEQRPGRFFHLGNEEYVLLSSHPDCDLNWLLALEEPDVRELTDHETVVLMERRRYRWHCGCNEQRILEILAPTMRADPDGLFGGEETIGLECPRCARRYRVSREALEAYVQRHE